MPAAKEQGRNPPGSASAKDAPGEILASKLEPQRQRSTLLTRDELVDELSRELDKRLLLVCAPAGYGKSTLLSQLHARVKALGHRVAWLALDASDNDPVRCVRHFIAALALEGTDADPERSFTEIGARHGMASGPSEDAVISQLRLAFERLSEDTFLFLDDMHLVTHASVHRLLRSLLESPLPKVHLVVAARHRPHWSLARLRAQGKVHEIDASRLAFGREESQQLMQQASTKALSAGQLDTLYQKTEGWPAGVQLVSLALKDEADAETFMRRFSGADRSVAEFLVEEVLQQQTQELQSFLLGTSVLKRFTAPMVNEVLQIENARALIDCVEELNLFLFPLDRNGDAYRYHALFAELLLQHLNDEDPARVRELHQRAGQWLAAHGQSVDAIDHALAAGDLERAGDWLDAASPGLFASGHTVTLQHYADRIPPAILGRLPRLQLEVVWEDIINWRFEKARRVLADVGARVGASQDANVAGDALAPRLAHREVMMDIFRDRLDAVSEQARLWHSTYGGADEFIDASVETAHLVSRREAFDFELIHAQWPELRRRFVAARAAYGTVFLDSVAGSTFLARGELAHAETALQQAMQTAASIQGQASPLAAMPTAQLAAVAYEQDRLHEAQRLLERAGTPDVEFGLVEASIARAVIGSRLAAIQRDFASAHRALDHGAHVAERHGLPRLRAHVLAERVRILIDEGIGKDARRLVKDIDAEKGALDGTQERLASARLRVLIEEGETVEALRISRRWLSWLHSRGANLSASAHGLLLTKVHLHHGDRVSAQRALIDALKRAAPGGVIRTILDEGPEIQALLAENASLIRESRLVDPAFLDRLQCTKGRTDTRAEDTVAVDTALSERELDIIRLAATNFRTEEIASALGVTESTVKWYWQRIFEKTGVRKRAMAVRLMRERGLVEKH